MSECVPHARARMLTSRLHPHVPPAQISPHVNVLRLDMCLPRFQHGSEGGLADSDTAAGALGMGASARGRPLMDRRQCALSQTRITTGWALLALVSTTCTCPCASTNHYANLHGVRHCSYILMAHGHGHPRLMNPSCPFHQCPFHDSKSQYLRVLLTLRSSQTLTSAIPEPCLHKS